MLLEIRRVEIVLALLMSQNVMCMYFALFICLLNPFLLYLDSWTRVVRSLCGEWGGIVSCVPTFEVRTL